MLTQSLGLADGVTFVSRMLDCTFSAVRNASPYHGPGCAPCISSADCSESSELSTVVCFFRVFLRGFDGPSFRGTLMLLRYSEFDKLDERAGASVGLGMKSLS